MILGKRIIVVMPAYNAERTLRQTYEEIPHDIVDDIILVDDASQDQTVRIAQELGLHHVIHPTNSGYGANQKTCYQEALKRGGDIVIMVHPDYQYTPKLIPAMAGMIAGGIYDVVLASRILGNGAIKGGMPRYNYWANRLLSFFQNLFLRQKLSEFHSGYRAFSRRVLESIPFQKNSDDFLFDNQLLLQSIFAGFQIGEISCPTHYDEDSSSMTLTKSVKTAFGVIGATFQFLLAKLNLIKVSIFLPKSEKASEACASIGSSESDIIRSN
ncbi:MAG: glycosyltransferase family 2 protein [bacterium]